MKVRSLGRWCAAGQLLPDVMLWPAVVTPVSSVSLY